MPEVTSALASVGLSGSETEERDRAALLMKNRYVRCNTCGRDTWTKHSPGGSCLAVMANGNFCFGTLLAAPNLETQPEEAVPAHPRYIRLTFKQAGRSPLRTVWAKKLDEGKYYVCDKEGEINENGISELVLSVPGKSKEVPAYMNKHYGELQVGRVVNITFTGGNYFVRYRDRLPRQRHLAGQFHGPDTTLEAVQDWVRRQPGLILDEDILGS